MQRPTWRQDIRGLSLYVLLPVLVFLALLLALAAGEIQSVQTARQDMSRYEEIALQHVADGAITLAPTNASEWNTAATVSGNPAETAFTQALTEAVAGTPWEHLPIHILAFQVFTASDVGQPAPVGYPTPTITSPGYYADVSFPWPLNLPGGGHVTLRVPETMQANVFSAPNTTWNPNP